MPKNRGECDAPTTIGKEIWIDPKQASELDRLDTIIHEVIHAAFWDLSEDAVAETASDLALILSQLGYVRALPLSRAA